LAIGCSGKPPNLDLIRMILEQVELQGGVSNFRAKKEIHHCFSPLMLNVGVSPD